MYNMKTLTLITFVLACLVAAATGAPPAAAPAASTAGDVPAPANTTAEPSVDAAAAAAEAEIDLSSIPKVAINEPIVTSSGGSTAVGQNNTKGAKAASGKTVAFDGFNPVWPADKQTNANQVLVEVVTDSPITAVKANQVPFIQSLADALGVSTSQVYWFKLLESDLNIATFLVDTDSPEAKAKALANLANPDNTARFYDNAAAYTLNILNGPQVAPEELQLSADVISVPDNYTAYNGDTGLISNNATAAGSSAQAAAYSCSLTLIVALLAVMVTLLSVM